MWAVRYLTAVCRLITYYGVSPSIWSLSHFSCLTLPSISPLLPSLYFSLCCSLSPPPHHTSPFITPSPCIAPLLVLTPSPSFPLLLCCLHSFPALISLPYHLISPHLASLLPSPHLYLLLPSPHLSAVAPACAFLSQLHEILFLGVLSGRLFLYDGLSFTTRVIRLRSKQDSCAVCGTSPTIHELIDYVQFCGSAADDKGHQLKVNWYLNVIYSIHINLTIIAITAA